MGSAFRASLVSEGYDGLCHQGDHGCRAGADGSPSVPVRPAICLVPPLSGRQSLRTRWSRQPVRGERPGWRVNVAGCPATSRAYPGGCDRPMTNAADVPALWSSHAEVVGMLKRREAVRFAGITTTPVMAGLVPAIHVLKRV